MAKVTIGLKVSENFKQKLIKLAQMENRNLSSWMLNALITYAKEHQSIELKYEDVLKEKSQK
jgi:uncharacterized protein (DUF1778 family)